MTRVAVCRRLRYSSFQAWFICLSFKVTLFLNVLPFGTTFSRWQAGYESWPMSTWVAQRNFFPWKILEETIGTKPPSFYCILFLKWGSRCFIPDHMFLPRLVSLQPHFWGLANPSLLSAPRRVAQSWGNFEAKVWETGICMECHVLSLISEIMLDVSRSILPQ